jgi:hypothetical protein
LTTPPLVDEQAEEAALEVVWAAEVTLTRVVGAEVGTGTSTGMEVIVVRAGAVVGGAETDSTGVAELEMTWFWLSGVLVTSMAAAVVVEVWAAVLVEEVEVEEEEEEEEAVEPESEDTKYFSRMGR